MSSVKLVRKTWVEVRSPAGDPRCIEVRTKDIGATIGTELIWSQSGLRIATYCPGTRYSDYAEDLAAELVGEALKTVPTGLGLIDFSLQLIEAIRSHKSVTSRPWNPDAEEESW
ncbi:hypothetical protein AB0D68_10980 [Streptomyces sp. NPDC048212]|uniref:hypothetical protein n=1 Tax=Streptomyces sp. NPDC048212 TaxID=3156658 RepID=UPI0033ED53ED